MQEVQETLDAVNVLSAAHNIQGTKVDAARLCLKQVRNPLTAPTSMRNRSNHTITKPLRPLLLRDEKRWRRKC